MNKSIKYLIKIYYWNYKDLTNQYSRDDKRIYFDILDANTNNRIALLNYCLPSFMDGMNIKDQFINNKFELLHFIPAINYSYFDSSNLKYDNFQIIKGENRNI